jgi:hypothetical protein
LRGRAFRLLTYPHAAGRDAKLSTRKEWGDLRIAPAAVCAHLKCAKCGSVGLIDPRPN